jgi:tetraacyldisaccharide 4'-kinase
VDLRALQDGGGGPSGALARVGLAAMSAGYAVATATHAALYRTHVLRARRLPVPVVSVGNLTAGGTGKTPFVAWLCERALAAGRRPGVLARGYGPRPTGSPLSDEGTLLRDLLGDRVPQEEDPDRYAAGRRLLARRGDVDLLVLDDGFQHRRLARDADVVLLDATDPFGGGRRLPRGRLRERPSGLARATAVVVTRADRVDRAALESLRARARALAPAAVLAAARTVASGWVRPSGEPLPLEALRGDGAFAWSGIGHPASFEASVASAGLRVLGHHRAPDHHAPTSSDLDAAARAARSAGASWIVVTRKDLVKWRALPSLPDGVVALDVRLDVLENEPALLAAALPPPPLAPAPVR